MGRKPAKRTGRSPIKAASKGVGSETTSPAKGFAQRFVISNLISHLAEGQPRADGLDRFNAKLEQLLLPSVDVVAESSRGRSRTNPERRIVVVDVDPRELQSMFAEMPANSIAEPELLRSPAVFYPFGLTPSVAAASDSPGTGATLNLMLHGPDGDAVAGATVMAVFGATATSESRAFASVHSDPSGAVSIPFDPDQWQPTLLAVEPVGGYWTRVAANPQSGQVLKLQALEQTGPLRWWHLLTGMTDYDATAGAGIKVGVIDSGVGPHPALAHAVPIGAFLDGSFYPGAAMGADVQAHGTHVSGIIGARPMRDSLTPTGLAPGADLFMARIFTAAGGGNQGDVANAVDTLSLESAVDVINMSLTGQPSAIEHDAIIAAYQRGTVCVCAAGNQGTAPVGAPAVYPECIAVSALGLVSGSPPGTMADSGIPAQADRFVNGAIYVASFSNTGPQLFCASAGNGIVSTIPAHPGESAPYVDMCGTSMAAPMAAGVLAAILSRSEPYAAMERNSQRAVAAKILFSQHCLSLGLNPLYQGLGIARSG